MTAPKPGDRVSEYVLTELLGSGTFGHVFKAVHHIWKDRFVAVKVPTHPQYVQSLRHEGVALHGLVHPNIVRAIGLDPFADPPYFIMELVEGCSLRQLLERCPGGLPIPTILAVITGILRGLDHAHTRGVLHRDIKPENVLIAGGHDDSPGDIRVDDVKVTDFGLGQALQVTTQSILQSASVEAEAGKSISGTLAYMSPEARDGRTCDAASDLYACGVLLFEIACGERPSGTESPGEIRSGLPIWVDEVFSRLYARRERRFSAASDALEAIAEAAAPPRGSAARGGKLPALTVPPVPPPFHLLVPVECPKCHAEVSGEDNFCTACGTQLRTRVVRCGICQGWLGPEDQFCEFCGAPLAAS